MPAASISAQHVERSTPLRVMPRRIRITRRAAATRGVHGDDTAAPCWATHGATSSKSAELRVRPWMQMTGQPCGAAGGARVVARVEAEAVPRRPAPFLE